MAATSYDDRFIPTGVGNGLAITAPPQRLPVHPHRRGERRGLLQLCIDNGGSSPQAWGTDAEGAKHH